MIGIGQQNAENESTAIYIVYNIYREYIGYLFTTFINNEEKRPSGLSAVSAAVKVKLTENQKVTTKK